MFFPKRMLHVEIDIPKEKVCDEVHSIGLGKLLHVDRTHKNIFFSNLHSKVHLLLQNIQKQMDTLGIHHRISSLEDLSLFEKHINKTTDIIKEIGTNIDKLSNEKDHIEQTMQQIELASEVSKSIEEIDIKSLLKINMFDFSVAIIPKKFYEFFELSISNSPVFTVSSELSKGSICIVTFYDSKSEKNINDVLEKVEAQKIELKYFNDEFIEKSKAKEAQISQVQLELKDKYEKTLLENESKLNAIYKLLDVQSSLISKENSYLLKGWIPKKQKEQFQKTILSSEVKFIKEIKKAPVLLKTPKLFEPFEGLIENFSYPNYNEVNPTVLFAFTFLSMFGMMFGDVGHGGVLTLIGYTFLKMDKHKVFAKIMISSGISAMFFGFLYGSFFGFHSLLPHLLFTPMENISKILFYGLVVGIFIITLSMFLNIYSKLKERNYYRLFFDSGGILWLLVYWFIVGIGVKYLLYNLGVKIEIYILIAILLLLSLMFLYKSRDVVQTILKTSMEVMEYATNTISFIRLGAFTLSHAALFLALFSIADVISQNTQTGLGYWLTMVIGNIVIIILEGVVVAIQTLRLEYYEFFKRFYSGGGEKYEPFILEEERDENIICV